MPNFSDRMKGNKGEWSEIYSFLKILSDRKLFSADKNLKELKNQFYTVLKVIREEAYDGEKTYDLTRDDDSVHVFDSRGKRITVFPIGKIRGRLKSIFEKIKAKTVASFNIPEASELMNELFCTQIKTSKQRKADIVLIIHDYITNLNPKVGFSIKSLVGAASTLLNASGATNFIYRIDNAKIDKKAINSIDSRSKIRDRIQHIYKSGGSLKFLRVSSNIFEGNLRKVDTILPNLLAEIIILFYLGKGASIRELIQNLSVDTLIDLSKYNLQREDCEFKIKNFLLYVALGMFPNKKWDGLLKAYGGYIVVKEDGNIVCYHMYNLDEFREYLFENTRIETPSSSRHGFGSVYGEQGHDFLKLNLQIRFTR